MNSNNQVLRNILILADQSAYWKVAGLRQIDRVLLALNAYAAGTQDGSKIFVQICWLEKMEPGRSDRELLHRQLPHLTFPERFDDDPILVTSTRIVVDHDSLKQLLNPSDATGERPALIVTAKESSQSLIERLPAAELKACPPRQQSRGKTHWMCLRDPSDIVYAEKWLLRRTGKSQDGFISRLINRPLSRSVSRLLLRFPLQPNHWTLLLTVVPLVGSIFLIQGNYLGFAVGAVFFQLHSALDGCDGEMARVKYLESEKGRKLDEVCDRFATLLYIFSIGIGLSRQSGIAEATRWFYLLEGMIVALLIGVSDTLLTRIPSQMLTAQGDHLDRYFTEHRQRFNRGDQLKLWVIKHSGLLFAGHRAASIFGEATKRDVFNFGFMLLALLGWPSLILHTLAISACMIAILTLKTFLAQPAAAKSAP